jgi:hypothetical protein
VDEIVEVVMLDLEDNSEKCFYYIWEFEVFDVDIEIVDHERKILMKVIADLSFA